MASSLHDCATAVAREPKVGSSIYRCDLGRLDASLIHRIFETLEQVVDFYNGGGVTPSGPKAIRGSPPIRYT